MPHLKLTFVAENPPPAYVFEQVALLGAEESGDYEWRLTPRGRQTVHVWAVSRPPDAIIRAPELEPAEFCEGVVPGEVAKAKFYCRDAE